MDTNIAPKLTPAELAELRAKFVKELRATAEINHCEVKLVGHGVCGDCHCAEGILLKVMGFKTYGKDMMERGGIVIEGFIQAEDAMKLGLPYPPFPVRVHGSKVSLVCANDGFHLSLREIADLVEVEGQREAEGVK